ncbi:glycosyltransferase family 2 protein [Streptomyces sp. NPDC058375]|uniref:glycosyltransferase family 2 protein n=1 Tax=Streptomyces sp. NPDC058375 TaxID=3346467 RepID=UPI00364FA11A
MRTAVITLAAGPHRHLALQQAGLAAGSRTPDQYIVVAMDDAGLRAVLADRRPAATIVDCPVRDGALPLARARNLGAAHALEHGAEYWSSWMSTASPVNGFSTATHRWPAAPPTGTPCSAVPSLTCRPRPRPATA